MKLCLLGLSPVVYVGCKGHKIGCGKSWLLWSICAKFVCFSTMVGRASRKQHMAPHHKQTRCRASFTMLKKSKSLSDEKQSTLPGLFCTLLSTKKNLHKDIMYKCKKRSYMTNPSILGLVPNILNTCLHSLPHTLDQVLQQHVKSI